MRYQPVFDAVMSDTTSLSGACFNPCTFNFFPSISLVDSKEWRINEVRDTKTVNIANA